MRTSNLGVLAVGLVAGCHAPMTPPVTSATTKGERTSFEADLAFLAKNGSVVVLEAPGGGRVAVSPKYQGRVMTSAVAPAGDSLGWIHRAFIESAKTGTPFDNYGGEDRFWLGPEGGQYGLYFPAGKPFNLDTWQTPSAFQEGEWSVGEQSSSSVAFQKAFTVSNYTGATFSMDVTRRIEVLAPEAVAKYLGTPIGDRIQWVGFETTNRVRNTGKEAWTEDKGLVSIWILGMFAPAPDGKVIVPFASEGGGPIVNDAYFGKVPAERLKVDAQQGYLVFTADGKLRSKIGLGPAHAKSVAGSYSPSKRLLTIVHYDKPAGATRYVNSMWEMQKEPFGGDVLNSYNDGPPAPGKPSLGGFYELETSSPAAALGPGQELVHVHRTFHFVGDKDALEPIAKQALGVSLDAAQ